MSGFHEVQFPTGISYGTSGGPGFNTHIIVTDSGQEERVARWSQARRKYDVAESIKTNADLAELLTFFMARMGSAYGFRFKDWSDYATTTDHTSRVLVTSNVDMTIGVGDGATTTFQLIKAYTNGGVSRIRTITKPVTGTLKVALDGVNQTSGFTVDTASGIVTFTTAPSVGIVVTAGFEFDTPVRFGDEIDGQLPISLDDYEDGSVKVPLIEIMDSGQASDEHFTGGAIEVQTADNYTMSSITRVWIFNFTAASKSVMLPATSGSSPGGPLFYIYNDGANDFTLKDASSTTICTVAAGSGVVMVLSINSIAQKVWYAK